MNLIGTEGPTGTTGYRADANQPGGYTQYTNLSAPEQQTYDLSKTAENGALGIANTQLGRVDAALGQTLNHGGVQTSYDPGGSVQQSFNQGGPLQYGFDPGQAVQGHVGPTDFNQAAQQASDAVYNQATSRLDPTWDQRSSQLDTRLANQGLSQNSDAYKNAQAAFGRDKNDAYNQAAYSSIGAGQNEQNTLFNQALNQGTFANQAAAQQYGQNQGQAAFNNTAAGQDYAQNLGAAQFGNQAQAQQNSQNQNAAGFGNQALGQQFSQDAYAQSLPINQFNSLMSSSQVGTPQAIGYTPSQAGQTDVLGAYALNQQAQNAAYQAQVANKSAGLGGLAQLGGAAIKTFGPAVLAASDARMKWDVKLIGREADGLGVYSYKYRGSDQPFVGVMAQEAQKLRPHAVHVHPSGYLQVEYGKL